MPGFLDLPPELIEQIYHEHEAALFAEKEDADDSRGIAETLGNLRLACRHIERSIRKSFVKVYFACWIIKRPDDKSILRFCEMTKTPDLAAALISMDILCDDDGTMIVQEAHPDHSSEISDLAERFTHALETSTDDSESDDSESEASSSPGREPSHGFDEATSAMVPLAYLKNKDALIKALQACQNITQLWFGNVPLDPDRMQLYYRVTDGQDDSNDAANDDADNVDTDGDDGEVDAEDDDPEDDDPEDADDDEVDADHADDDGDEGDEGDEGDGGDHEDDNGNDNVHRYEIPGIMVDVTSTFTYFLFLAGKAGVQPKKISTFHKCSSGPLARVNLGLTGCPGLAKLNSLSEKVEELSLDFIHDRRHPASEETGSQVGRQLGEWYTNMPALTHLLLDFEMHTVSHERSCIATWKEIADARARPSLKKLCIGKGICSMDLCDFITLIANHVPSLEELKIPHMHLYHGFFDSLGHLYEGLSLAPNIKSLRQNTIHLSDELVKFPAHICLPIIGRIEDEDGLLEDEDDYVWVQQTSKISWKGHDEVTDVLATMAKHLRVK